MQLGGKLCCCNAIWLTHLIDINQADYSLWGQLRGQQSTTTHSWVTRLMFSIICNHVKLYMHFKISNWCWEACTVLFTLPCILPGYDTTELKTNRRVRAQENKQVSIGNPRNGERRTSGCCNTEKSKTSAALSAHKYSTTLLWTSQLPMRILKSESRQILQPVFQLQIVPRLLAASTWTPTLSPIPWYERDGHLQVSYDDFYREAAHTRRAVA